MASAALARRIASAIRPIAQRWQRFWDVEHCRTRFMTEEEFEDASRRAVQMQRSFHRAGAFSALRSKITDAAASHGADSTSVLSTEGRTIGGMAPELYHALHIAIIVLPLLLVYAVIARVEPPDHLRAQFTNKNVLDARLQLLESRLGLSDAPAAPVHRDGGLLQPERERSVNAQLMERVLGQSAVANRAAASSELDERTHAAAVMEHLQARVEQLEARLRHLATDEQPVAVPAVTAQPAAVTTNTDAVDRPAVAR